MPARERFGFNAPAGQPLEAAVAWAGAHGFTSVDFNADRGPNDLAAFDDARVAALRDLAAGHGVRYGIHTSSAVNVAEVAPFVGEAVDEYLAANVRLAARLGAAWVIVHGGFHFGDTTRRREAAVARLERLLEVAADARIPLWFENHNVEPEHAEIHYIPDDVAEMRWYLEAPGLRDSPWFRWTLNAGHAELVPDRVGGFLAAFGVARIAQVRLMDNPGTYELHLKPGDGVLDFPALFRQIEGAGYTGPYCLDFPGTEGDRIAVRDAWSRL